MISIEEAKRIIEDNLPQRQTEKINLTDAMNRVLAEDINAPEPSPRFTNSAMDGFAARWEDVQNVSDSNPITLPIVGESSAGVPFLKTLQKGQAIQISTGAMLPEGADTVIPQEDTKTEETTVTILKVKKKNQNIRFQEKEFKRGDIILHKGAEINPMRAGLLASSGIQQLSVYRKPRISVIVTGTEVQPFDAPVKPWQIRDSNSIMLQSAIQAAGGEVILNKIVGDSRKETQTHLEEATQKTDLIIFSGGVSVGPHDLVKDVASDFGFQTLFWRVNQKPGKPLFVAKKKNVLLFGLPGNPVSAYMCFLLYVQPVIRHFQGKEEDHKIITAKLKVAIDNDSTRDQFFRVKMEKGADNIPYVVSLKKQGSHMLTSLTEADGFILIGAGKTISADNEVRVNLF